MKNYYDLIHQKNSLPSGNVYLKNIKGNSYFYYQYRENGINYSRKISNDEVKELLEKIKQRKAIETEIKNILKDGNKELELSASAREYTGYVMSGDKVVAEFEKGELKTYDERLCPVIIKRTNSLINFLKSRSIDSGRTNSRLLRKVLNINVKDDTLVSLCSYAASITDNYWFKPKHSKLKYKDIAFTNDIFFNTSLKGLITLYPNKLVLTPELTTNGSYEKGWRNINDEWWLYKAGTKEEIYSELFYSKLFEKLNLPTAHYELDGEYIKSLNFSPKHNFEPMISLVGDDENIEVIYDSLNKINHQIALDYLRLCVFDVTLNNVDRHNENCGILRDRKTGKILSLAPNYDNNISLISRTMDLNLTLNEGFIKLFLKTISNTKILSALKEINFPEINDDILNKVNEEIEVPVSVDFDHIKSFIINRYSAILRAINK